MQEIEKLGAEVEQRWAAVQYQADDFAAIAQEALESRTLTSIMSIESIIRWFVLSPQVPHQPAGELFGEPPIKVFSGRRFHIEVLFWVDGTTNIHQHAFSGAFQVLSGRSIHTTYRFERETAVNRELLLGTLAVTGSELLGVGDIRPIISGDRFIHSLFHLDRPSVTLVVRTDQDAGTCPQYSYLHPGIAYAPFVTDERASRQRHLLELLDPRSTETTQLLVEVVAQADPWSIVSMLMHWFRLHPIDAPTSEALLGTVARRHRMLAHKLAAAAQEGRRQALIISRRRRHHRVELRFFLALLLNVGDRDRILSFVKQCYPGADPIELIVSWLEDLIASPVTDRSGARTTDAAEYDLGEAELQVFRYLLQQRTPDQIITALDAEYEHVEDHRGRILEICASLTNSALFRPLFRMPA